MVEKGLERESDDVIVGESRRASLEGESGYMTAIRKFRNELGLELHVTELDIGIAEGDSIESQGVYYQEFMEALLKEKNDGANITSVTFWGLLYGKIRSIR